MYSSPIKLSLFFEFRRASYHSSWKITPTKAGMNLFQWSGTALKFGEFSGGDSNEMRMSAASATTMKIKVIRR